MGVTVFDSDVVIGFLNGADAHHADAVGIMRDAMNDAERWLCSVNYSEILVGPIRVGKQATVEAMLGHFGFTIVPLDRPLAERAATVRARTGLKLPDAYALATVIQGERRGHENVKLVSFDKRVLAARQSLQA